jgi:hypothetical protein
MHYLAVTTYFDALCQQILKGGGKLQLEVMDGDVMILASPF